MSKLKKPKVIDGNLIDGKPARWFELINGKPIEVDSISYDEIPSTHADPAHLPAALMTLEALEQAAKITERGRKRLGDARKRLGDALDLLPDYGCELPARRPAPVRLSGAGLEGFQLRTMRIEVLDVQAYEIGVSYGNPATSYRVVRVQGRVIDVRTGEPVPVTAELTQPADMPIAEDTSKPYVYYDSRTVRGLTAPTNATWFFLSEPSGAAPAASSGAPKCVRCGIFNEYQPGPFTCWQCKQDPWR